MRIDINYLHVSGPCKTLKVILLVTTEKVELLKECRLELESMVKRHLVDNVTNSPRMEVIYQ